MPAPDAQDPVTPAMRLIFEYDGDQVQLVKQQLVDVAITGHELARTRQAGYYVDTRNAAGEALARVHLHDAFASSVEVFPEQMGKPIERVDVPSRKGAFTVVVPVPEGTDHVAIVQLQLTAAAPAGAAARTEQLTTTKEIGRFPLLIVR